MMPARLLLLGFLCLAALPESAFSEKALATKSAEGQHLEIATSSSRKIGMYIQLDLYRNNRFNKPLMANISNFDSKLRQCYTQNLRDNRSLRGTIVFKILISERTGNMRRIKRSGGSLASVLVTDCLVRELEQIPMPVQHNMVGELKVLFEVT